MFTWDTASHELYSIHVEVRFSLWIPLRCCISTSVCLDLTLETWAKATVSHYVQTHDSNHTCSLAIVKALNQWMPVQTENCPQCQEWRFYKVRVVFLKLLCVKRKRNGLPSDNRGFSISKHDSRHVLWCGGWHPSTSPCPTLSACKVSRAYLHSILHSAKVSKSGSSSCHSSVECTGRLRKFPWYMTWPTVQVETNWIFEPLPTK